MGFGAKLSDTRAKISMLKSGSGGLFSKAQTMHSSFTAAASSCTAASAVPETAIFEDVSDVPATTMSDTEETEIDWVLDGDQYLSQDPDGSDPELSGLDPDEARFLRH